MTSFFEKLKGSINLDDVQNENEEILKEEEVKPKPKRAKSKSPQEEEVKKIKVANTENHKPKESKEASMEDWLEDGELTVDVYQTPEEVVIQSAIAGVKPEDVDISIEEDTVIIKGERRNEIKEEKKNYIHQECFWGSFSRQIILPEEVDASRAEASFRDGVLTLRLPKASRQKVKKIKLS